MENNDKISKKYSRDDLDIGGNSKKLERESRNSKDDYERKSEKEDESYVQKVQKYAKAAIEKKRKTDRVQGQLNKIRELDKVESYDWKQINIVTKTLKECRKDLLTFVSKGTEIAFSSNWQLYLTSIKLKINEFEENTKDDNEKIDKIYSAHYDDDTGLHGLSSRHVKDRGKLAKIRENISLYKDDVGEQSKRYSSFNSEFYEEIENARKEVEALEDFINGGYDRAFKAHVSERLHAQKEKDDSIDNQKIVIKNLIKEVATKDLVKEDATNKETEDDDKNINEYIDKILKLLQAKEIEVQQLKAFEEVVGRINPKEYDIAGEFEGTVWDLGKGNQGVTQIESNLKNIFELSTKETLSEADKKILAYDFYDLVSETSDKMQIDEYGIPSPKKNLALQIKDFYDDAREFANDSKVDDIISQADQNNDSEQKKKERKQSYFIGKFRYKYNDILERIKLFPKISWWYTKVVPLAYSLEKDDDLQALKGLSPQSEISAYVSLMGTCMASAQGTDYYKENKWAEFLINNTRTGHEKINGDRYEEELTRIQKAQDIINENDKNLDKLVMAISSGGNYDLGDFVGTLQSLFSVKLKKTDDAEKKPSESKRQARKKLLERYKKNYANMLETDEKFNKDFDFPDISIMDFDNNQIDTTLSGEKNWWSANDREERKITQKNEDGTFLIVTKSAGAETANEWEKTGKIMEEKILSSSEFYGTPVFKNGRNPAEYYSMILQATESSTIDQDILETFTTLMGNFDSQMNVTGLTNSTIGLDKRADIADTDYNGLDPSSMWEDIGSEGHVAGLSKREKKVIDIFLEEEQQYYKTNIKHVNTMNDELEKIVDKTINGVLTVASGLIATDGGIKGGTAGFHNLVKYIFRALARRKQGDYNYYENQLASYCNPDDRPDDVRLLNKKEFLNRCQMEVPADGTKEKGKGKGKEQGQGIICDLFKAGVKSALNIVLSDPQKLDNLFKLEGEANASLRGVEANDTKSEDQLFYARTYDEKGAATYKECDIKEAYAKSFIKRLKNNLPTSGTSIEPMCIIENIFCRFFTGILDKDKVASDEDQELFEGFFKQLLVVVKTRIETGASKFWGYYNRQIKEKRRITDKVEPVNGRDGKCTDLNSFTRAMVECSVGQVSTEKATNEDPGVNEIKKYFLPIAHSIFLRREKFFAIVNVSKKENRASAEKEEKNHFDVQRLKMNAGPMGFAEFVAKAVQKNIKDNNLLPPMSKGQNEEQFEAQKKEIYKKYMTDVLHYIYANGKTQDETRAKIKWIETDRELAECLNAVGNLMDYYVRSEACYRKDEDRKNRRKDIFKQFLYVQYLFAFIKPIAEYIQKKTNEQKKDEAKGYKKSLVETIARMKEMRTAHNLFTSIWDQLLNSEEKPIDNLADKDGKGSISQLIKDPKDKNDKNIRTPHQYFLYYRRLYSPVFKALAANVVSKANAVLDNKDLKINFDGDLVQDSVAKGALTFTGDLTKYAISNLTKIQERQEGDKDEKFTTYISEEKSKADERSMNFLHITKLDDSNKKIGKGYVDQATLVAYILQGLQHNSEEIRDFLMQKASASASKEEKEPLENIVELSIETSFLRTLHKNLKISIDGLQNDGSNENKDFLDALKGATGTKEYFENVHSDLTDDYLKNNKINLVDDSNKLISEMRTRVEKSELFQQKQINSTNKPGDWSDVHFDIQATVKKVAQWCRRYQEVTMGFLGEKAGYYTYLINEIKQIEKNRKENNNWTLTDENALNSKRLQRAEYAKIIMCVREHYAKTRRAVALAQKEVVFGAWLADKEKALMSENINNGRIVASLTSKFVFNRRCALDMTNPGVQQLNKGFYSDKEKSHDKIRNAHLHKILGEAVSLDIASEMMDFQKLASTTGNTVSYHTGLTKTFEKVSQKMVDKKNGSEVFQWRNFFPHEGEKNAADEGSGWQKLNERSEDIDQTEVLLSGTEFINSFSDALKKSIENNKIDKQSKGVITSSNIASNAFKPGEITDFEEHMNRFDAYTQFLHSFEEATALFKEATGKHQDEVLKYAEEAQKSRDNRRTELKKLQAEQAKDLKDGGVINKALEAQAVIDMLFTRAPVDKIKGKNAPVGKGKNIKFLIDLFNDGAHGFEDELNNITKRDKDYEGNEEKEYKGIQTRGAAAQQMGNQALNVLKYYVMGEYDDIIKISQNSKKSQTNGTTALYFAERNLVADARDAFTDMNKTMEALAPECIDRTLRTIFHYIESCTMFDWQKASPNDSEVVTEDEIKKSEDELKKFDQIIEPLGMEGIVDYVKRKRTVYKEAPPSINGRALKPTYHDDYSKDMWQARLYDLAASTNDFKHRMDIYVVSRATYAIGQLYSCAGQTIDMSMYAHSEQKLDDQEDNIRDTALLISIEDKIRKNQILSAIKSESKPQALRKKKKDANATATKNTESTSFDPGDAFVQMARAASLKKVENEYNGRISGLAKCANDMKDSEYKLTQYKKLTDFVHSTREDTKILLAKAAKYMTEASKAKTIPAVGKGFEDAKKSYVTLEKTYTLALLKAGINVDKCKATYAVNTTSINVNSEDAKDKKPFKEEAANEWYQDIMYIIWDQIAKLDFAIARANEQKEMAAFTANRKNDAIIHLDKNASLEQLEASMHKEYNQLAENYGKREEQQFRHALYNNKDNITKKITEKIKTRVQETLQKNFENAIIVITGSSVASKDLNGMLDEVLEKGDKEKFTNAMYQKLIDNMKKVLKNEDSNFKDLIEVECKEDGKNEKVEPVLDADEEAEITSKMLSQNATQSNDKNKKMIKVADCNTNCYFTVKIKTDKGNNNFYTKFKENIAKECMGSNVADPFNDNNVVTNKQLLRVILRECIAHGVICLDKKTTLAELDDNLATTIATKIATNNQGYKYIDWKKTLGYFHREFGNNEAKILKSGLTSESNPNQDQQMEDISTVENYVIDQLIKRRIPIKELLTLENQNNANNLEGNNVTNDVCDLAIKKWFSQSCNKMINSLELTEEEKTYKAESTETSESWIDIARELYGDKNILKTKDSIIGTTKTIVKNVNDTVISGHIGKLRYSEKLGERINSENQEHSFVKETAKIATDTTLNSYQKKKALVDLTEARANEAIDYEDWPTNDNTQSEYGITKTEFSAWREKNVGNGEDVRNYKFVNDLERAINSAKSRQAKLLEEKQKIEKSNASNRKNSTERLQKMIAAIELTLNGEVLKWLGVNPNERVETTVTARKDEINEKIIGAPPYYASQVMIIIDILNRTQEEEFNKYLEAMYKRKSYDKFITNDYGSKEEDRKHLGGLYLAYVANIESGDVPDECEEIIAVNEIHAIVEKGTPDKNGKKGAKKVSVEDQKTWVEGALNKFFPDTDANRNNPLVQLLKFSRENKPIATSNFTLKGKTEEIKHEKDELVRWYEPLKEALRQFLAAYALDCFDYHAYEFIHNQENPKYRPINIHYYISKRGTQDPQLKNILGIINLFYKNADYLSGDFQTCIQNCDRITLLLGKCSDNFKELAAYTALGDVFENDGTIKPGKNKAEKKKINKIKGDFDKSNKKLDEETTYDKNDFTTLAGVTGMTKATSSESQKVALQNRMITQVLDFGIAEDVKAYVDNVVTFTQGKIQLVLNEKNRIPFSIEFYNELKEQLPILGYDEEEESYSKQGKYLLKHDDSFEIPFAPLISVFNPALKDMDNTLFVLYNATENIYKKALADSLGATKKLYVEFFNAIAMEWLSDVANKLYDAKRARNLNLRNKDKGGNDNDKVLVLLASGEFKKYLQSSIVCEKFNAWYKVANKKASSKAEKSIIYSLLGIVSPDYLSDKGIQEAHTSALDATSVSKGSPMRAHINQKRADLLKAVKNTPSDYENISTMARELHTYSKRYLLGKYLGGNNYWDKDRKLHQHLINQAISTQIENDRYLVYVAGNLREPFKTLDERSKKSTPKDAGHLDDIMIERKKIPGITDVDRKGEYLGNKSGVKRYLWHYGLTDAVRRKDKEYEIVEMVDGGVQQVLDLIYILENLFVNYGGHYREDTFENKSTADNDPNKLYTNDAGKLTTREQRSINISERLRRKHVLQGESKSDEYVMTSAKSITFPTGQDAKEIQNALNKIQNDTEKQLEDDKTKKIVDRKRIKNSQSDVEKAISVVIGSRIQKLCDIINSSNGEEGFQNYFIDNSSIFKLPNRNCKLSTSLIYYRLGVMNEETLGTLYLTPNEAFKNIITFKDILAEDPKGQTSIEGTLKNVLKNADLEEEAIVNRILEKKSKQIRSIFLLNCLSTEAINKVKTWVNDSLTSLMHDTDGADVVADFTVKTHDTTNEDFLKWKQKKNDQDFRNKVSADNKLSKGATAKEKKLALRKIIFGKYGKTSDEEFLKANISKRESYSILGVNQEFATKDENDRDKEDENGNKILEKRTIKTSYAHLKITDDKEKLRKGNGWNMPHKKGRVYDPNTDSKTFHKGRRENADTTLAYEKDGNKIEEQGETSIQQYANYSYTGSHYFPGELVQRSKDDNTGTWNIIKSNKSDENMSEAEKDNLKEVSYVDGQGKRVFAQDSNGNFYKVKESSFTGKTRQFADNMVKMVAYSKVFNAFFTGNAENGAHDAPSDNPVKTTSMVLRNNLSVKQNVQKQAEYQPNSKTRGFSKNAKYKMKSSVMNGYNTGYEDRYKNLLNADTGAEDTSKFTGTEDISRYDNRLYANPLMKYARYGSATNYHKHTPWDPSEPQQAKEYGDVAPIREIAVKKKNEKTPSESSSAIRFQRMFGYQRIGEPKNGQGGAHHNSALKYNFATGKNIQLDQTTTEKFNLDDNKTVKKDFFAGALSDQFKYQFDAIKYGKNNISLNKDLDTFVQNYPELQRPPRDDKKETGQQANYNVDLVYRLFTLGINEKVLDAKKIRTILVTVFKNVAEKYMKGRESKLLDEFIQQGVYLFTLRLADMDYKEIESLNISGDEFLDLPFLCVLKCYYDRMTVNKETGSAMEYIGRETMAADAGIYKRAKRKFYELQQEVYTADGGAKTVKAIIQDTAKDRNNIWKTFNESGLSDGTVEEHLLGSIPDEHLGEQGANDENQEVLGAVGQFANNIYERTHRHLGILGLNLDEALSRRTGDGKQTHYAFYNNKEAFTEQEEGRDFAINEKYDYLIEKIRIGYEEARRWYELTVTTKQIIESLKSKHNYGTADTVMLNAFMKEALADRMGVDDASLTPAEDLSMNYLQLGIDKSKVNILRRASKDQVGSLFDALYSGNRIQNVETIVQQFRTSSVQLVNVFLHISNIISQELFEKPFKMFADLYDKYVINAYAVMPPPNAEEEARGCLIQAIEAPISGHPNMFVKEFVGEANDVDSKVDITNYKVEFGTSVYAKQAYANEAKEYRTTQMRFLLEQKAMQSKKNVEVSHDETLIQYAFRNELLDMASDESNYDNKFVAPLRKAFLRKIATIYHKNANTSRVTFSRELLEQNKNVDNQEEHFKNLEKTDASFGKNFYNETYARSEVNRQNKVLNEYMDKNPQSLMAKDIENNESKAEFKKGNWADEYNPSQNDARTYYAMERSLRISIATAYANAAAKNKQHRIFQRLLSQDNNESKDNTYNEEERLAVLYALEESVIDFVDLSSSNNDDIQIEGVFFYTPVSTMGINHKNYMTMEELVGTILETKEFIYRAENYLRNLQYERAKAAGDDNLNKEILHSLLDLSQYEKLDAEDKADKEKGEENLERKNIKAGIDQDINELTKLLATVVSEGSNNHLVQAAKLLTNGVTTDSERQKQVGQTIGNSVGEGINPLVSKLADHYNKNVRNKTNDISGDINDDNAPLRLIVKMLYHRFHSRIAAFLGEMMESVKEANPFEKIVASVFTYNAKARNMEIDKGITSQDEYDNNINYGINGSSPYYAAGLDLFRQKDPAFYEFWKKAGPRQTYEMFRKTHDSLEYEAIRRYLFNNKRAVFHMVKHCIENQINVTFAGRTLIPFDIVPKASRFSGATGFKKELSNLSKKLFDDKDKGSSVEALFNKGIFPKAGTQHVVEIIRDYIRDKIGAPNLKETEKAMQNIEVQIAKQRNLGALHSMNSATKSLYKFTRYLNRMQFLDDDEDARVTTATEQYNEKKAKDDLGDAEYKELVEFQPRNPDDKSIGQGESAEWKFRSAQTRRLINSYIRAMKGGEYKSIGWALITTKVGKNIIEESKKQFFKSATTFSGYAEKEEKAYKDLLKTLGTWAESRDEQDKDPKSALEERAASEYYKTLFRHVIPVAILDSDNRNDIEALLKKLNLDEEVNADDIWAMAQFANDRATIDNLLQQGKDKNKDDELKLESKYLKILNVLYARDEEIDIKINNERMAEILGKIGKVQEAIINKKSDKEETLGSSMEKAHKEETEISNKIKVWEKEKAQLEKEKLEENEKDPNRASANKAKKQQNREKIKQLEENIKNAEKEVAKLEKYQKDKEDDKKKYGEYTEKHFRSNDKDKRNYIGLWRGLDTDDFECYLYGCSIGECNSILTELRNNLDYYTNQSLELNKQKANNKKGKPVEIESNVSKNIKNYLKDNIFKLAQKEFKLGKDSIPALRAYEKERLKFKMAQGKINQFISSEVLSVNMNRLISEHLHSILYKAKDADVVATIEAIEKADFDSFQFDSKKISDELGKGTKEQQKNAGAMVDGIVQNQLYKLSTEIVNAGLKSETSDEKKTAAKQYWVQNNKDVILKSFGASKVTDEDWGDFLEGLSTTNNDKITKFTDKYGKTDEHKKNVETFLSTYNNLGNISSDTQKESDTKRRNIMNMKIVMAIENDNKQLSEVGKKPNHGDLSKNEDDMYMLFLSSILTLFLQKDEKGQEIAKTVKEEDVETTSTMKNNLNEGTMGDEEKKTFTENFNKTLETDYSHRVLRKILSSPEALQALDAYTRKMVSSAGNELRYSEEDWNVLVSNSDALSNKNYFDEIEINKFASCLAKPDGKPDSDVSKEDEKANRRIIEKIYGKDTGMDDESIRTQDIINMIEDNSASSLRDQYKRDIMAELSLQESKIVGILTAAVNQINNLSDRKWFGLKKRNKKKDAEEIMVAALKEIETNLAVGGKQKKVDSSVEEAQDLEMKDYNSTFNTGDRSGTNKKLIKYPKMWAMIYQLQEENKQRKDAFEGIDVKSLDGIDTTYSIENGASQGLMQNSKDFAWKELRSSLVKQAGERENQTHNNVGMLQGHTEQDSIFDTILQVAGVTSSAATMIRIFANPEGYMYEDSTIGALYGEGAVNKLFEALNWVTGDRNIMNRNKGNSLFNPHFMTKLRGQEFTASTLNMYLSKLKILDRGAENTSGKAQGLQDAWDALRFSNNKSLRVDISKPESDVKDNLLELLEFVGDVSSLDANASDFEVKEEKTRGLYLKYVYSLFKYSVQLRKIHARSYECQLDRKFLYDYERYTEGTITEMLRMAETDDDARFREDFESNFDQVDEDKELREQLTSKLTKFKEAFNSGVRSIDPFDNLGMGNMQHMDNLEATAGQTGEDSKSKLIENLNKLCLQKLNQKFKKEHEEVLQFEIDQYHFDNAGVFGVIKNTALVEIRRILLEQATSFAISTVTGVLKNFVFGLEPVKQLMALPGKIKDGFEKAKAFFTGNVIDKVKAFNPLDAVSSIIKAFNPF